MIKVGELFDVKYGVNLELNRLENDANGINFVSRTAKNNGVSARVKRLTDVEPIPAGMITVAGGGSVMESFVQPEQFYSGRDLYYLKPLIELTLQEKIYYCMCIRANKYRYNYGRQANRTLRDILVPSSDQIPEWVNKFDVGGYVDFDKPLQDEQQFTIDTDKWLWFKYSALFDIKKGKRITKRDMRPGPTPCIRPIEINNGVTGYINHAPNHKGNTITVSYNGSVGEAFYQERPHFSLDDVNVLYPRFTLNKYIAMFLCTLIRKEKYRFNYGRKWHLERMNESTMKLPVANSGEPDWQYMGNYIKSLNFSGKI